MPNLENKPSQPPVNKETGLSGLPESLPRIRGRAGMMNTYIEGAIADYRAGDLEHIPSPADLAGQFGYQGPLGVALALRNSPIRSQLESIYKESNIIYPSSEWAWMIGVIALGGGSNELNGQVSLASSSVPLLNAFRSRGIELFNTNPIVIPQSTTAKRESYRKVAFGNKYLVNILGDMRRQSWPQTVRERHNWIMEDDEFIWAFLSGGLEVRGYVSNKPRKRRIMFNTNYRVIANTISDLLVRVGVDEPFIKTDHSTREGIKGVDITRLEDVRHLARNIHSVDPAREEILQELRELQIKPPARVSSLDEVAVEWRRLKDLLGHTPNSNEIAILKKQGKTPFSVKVYMNWAGHLTWREASTFFENLDES